MRIIKNASLWFSTQTSAYTGIQVTNILSYLPEGCEMETGSITYSGNVIDPFYFYVFPDGELSFGLISKNSGNNYEILVCKNKEFAGSLINTAGQATNNYLYVTTIDDQCIIGFDSQPNTWKTLVYAKDDDEGYVCMIPRSGSVVSSKRIINGMLPRSGTNFAWIYNVSGISAFNFETPAMFVVPEKVFYFTSHDSGSPFDAIHVLPRLFTCTHDDGLYGNNTGVITDVETGDKYIQYFPASQSNTIKWLFKLRDE